MSMAMGMPVVAQVASETGITGLLSWLSGNKFFSAVLMILMNLSGRYLDIELLPFQKQFLQSSFIRRVVIFAVAFMATRDILSALIVASVFIIVVFHLCNTQSPYCILPDWYKALDTNGDGVVSWDEYKSADLKKYKDFLTE